MSNTHCDANEVKVSSFLEELTELSRRRGVYIEGCGCCGSPRLTLIDETDAARRKYGFAPKHTGFGDELRAWTVLEFLPAHEAEASEWCRRRGYRVEHLNADGTLVYEDEDAFEVQTKRTKQWARPSDKET